MVVVTNNEYNHNHTYTHRQHTHKTIACICRQNKKIHKLAVQPFELNEMNRQSNKPIQQINIQRINSRKRGEKSGLPIFPVIRFACEFVSVLVSVNIPFKSDWLSQLSRTSYCAHTQTHTLLFIWLFIFGLLLMHTVRSHCGIEESCANFTYQTSLLLFVLV